MTYINVCWWESILTVSWRDRPVIKGWKSFEEKHIYQRYQIQRETFKHNFIKPKFFNDRKCFMPGDALSHYNASVFRDKYFEQTKLYTYM